MCLVDEAETECWNPIIDYEEQESGLSLNFGKEVRIALKLSYDRCEVTT